MLQVYSYNLDSLRAYDIAHAELLNADICRLTFGRPSVVPSPTARGMRMASGPDGIARPRFGRLSRSTGFVVRCVSALEAGGSVTPHTGTSAAIPAARGES
jgi:hypothetical protein